LPEFAKNHLLSLVLTLPPHASVQIQIAPAVENAFNVSPQPIVLEDNLAEITNVDSVLLPVIVDPTRTVLVPLASTAFALTITPKLALEVPLVTPPMESALNVKLIMIAFPVLQANYV